MSEEVAGSVDLDLEARLSTPPGYELVRLVLGERRMRAVGAWPTADGIELLQALVYAHPNQPIDREAGAA